MPIDFESCHADCEHHSHKKCCSVGAFHQLKSGARESLVIKLQWKMTKLALKRPETTLQMALKLFLFSALLFTDR